MPTQRYMVTLGYRGTQYFGWQHQAANPLTWKGPWPDEADGIPTIQTVASRTLGSVLGHPVSLVGASRTDSGVHAKGQVAHFDTDQLQIPPEGMRRAVNARLPGDILIHSIEPVDSSFHAIRSTVSKRYQYYIWNAPDRPLFFADLAWHRAAELNVPAMMAAAALEGEHDFTSFAKPGHARQTTVRTIHSCSVSRRGANLVVGVEGNGFLWNMVRIIAGTLVDVGMGRIAAAEMGAILEAKDRRVAGGTAPPHGLFLQWVRVKQPN